MLYDILLLETNWSQQKYVHYSVFLWYNSEFPLKLLDTDNANKIQIVNLQGTTK